MEDGNSAIIDTKYWEIKESQSVNNDGDIIPDFDNDPDFQPSTCSCGSGEFPEDIYDARGIYLTQVCSKCKKEKLRGYRPEVLSNPNYHSDEPIEPDDGWEDRLSREQDW